MVISGMISSMQKIRLFLHSEANDCKDEISQLMQDTDAQAVLLKNMLQQSKNMKMVQRSCKHLCKKMKMNFPSIAEVSGAVFWPHLLNCIVMSSNLTLCSIPEC